MKMLEMHIRMFFKIKRNIKRINILNEMRTTINTLKKYSKHIKNTLEYSYSNGEK